MRQRLSKDQRRAEILAAARTLFLERGFSATEMEDIRKVCGISRGGLYHHFENRRAVLAALVDAEVAELAEVVGASASPLTDLLRAGSTHLGAEPGVLAAVSSREAREDYLAALEQAFFERLLPPLRASLAGQIRPGVPPQHVAELFLTVNGHINRRTVLGVWSEEEAAGFAATALRALIPLLKQPGELEVIAAELTKKGAPP